MTTGRLAGKRVLVVEDEIFIAYDIATSLSEAGAEIVGPCGNLDQACAVAASADIDLAILDIDLAGREVFPAAEILQRRDIAFLFHSGRPDRERLADEFAHVPVFIKPVSMDTLIEGLSNLRRVAA